MQDLIKRLTNLLTVKSLVTIILTGVFAYMTCSGYISGEQFLTIFTVVISFYFGSQVEKSANKNNQ